LTLARRSTLRGVAGRPLSELELRATDRYGNPVPEVSVSLRPAQGAVAERAVVTDSAGRAKPIWTLGTAAGVQRLSASVDGMPAPLEIAVRVTAGAPAKVAFEGVPASGTVGRPLPQTVRAVVSDAHGNPAAGVSVVFSTKTGTVAPTRARTDSAGRAQTRWTLSPRVGDQVLEAVVKEGGARGAARVRGIRSRRGS
jgi:adhesin/invasin